MLVSTCLELRGFEISRTKKDNREFAKIYTEEVSGSPFSFFTNDEKLIDVLCSLKKGTMYNFVFTFYMINGNSLMKLSEIKEIKE